MQEQPSAVSPPIDQQEQIRQIIDFGPQNIATQEMQAPLPGFIVIRDAGQKGAP